ncbi:MAG TPA: 4Fe-4S binding protein [Planctomycetota bacterium]|jgi:ferredoxin|nr:4Fe-4S binding protein [Planctomycetota bacterium]OQC18996.1 MAG: putative electron transport protein YccM [Planctomycetes bacterium ADurb.Bin069]HNR99587.1 4Fe-4S binding protein [Planctomycetota bacterium]HNU26477.1 4Fe-4S binding protein [Planctomycetota bacterium]HOE28389.1 4Fe-4S binding protein [Planctomycetota bacterium]
MRFPIVPTLALVAILSGGRAAAEQRFPPPDFSPGYSLPVTEAQGAPARADARGYIDAAVLAGALALASYLALGRRSRRGLVLLGLGSLAYFGFYRHGCICPVGAVQNVVLAITDPGYALPLTAALFFALPLLFTLFFGRAFCAAVCPLGAVQDVVLASPVAVPGWLARALGLVPFVYLGAAVLLVATGSTFLICRYDPFVGFFRLSAGLDLTIYGAALLIIGVFVGRPYCRFLCPYGALLGLVSRLSWRRVTITPAECVRCRLCEDACPFGAITTPSPETPPARRAGKTALAVTLLALPLLMGLGALAGRALSPAFAHTHATIRLAERVWLEEAGEVEGTTDQSDAFRATGLALDDLYLAAGALRARFDTGTTILGVFAGLAAGATLLRVSLRRTRRDYEADPALCLACGRCYRYCPVETDRGKRHRKPREAAP